eukprot:127603_1
MTGVNNSSHGPQALRDLMDVCDQLHVVSSRLWDTDRELVSLEKKRVTIVSDRKLYGARLATAAHNATSLQQKCDLLATRKVDCQRFLLEHRENLGDLQSKRHQINEKRRSLAISVSDGAELKDRASADLTGAKSHLDEVRAQFEQCEKRRASESRALKQWSDQLQASESKCSETKGRLEALKSEIEEKSDLEDAHNESLAQQQILLSDLVDSLEIGMSMAAKNAKLKRVNLNSIIEEMDTFSSRRDTLVSNVEERSTLVGAMETSEWEMLRESDRLDQELCENSDYIVSIKAMIESMSKTSANVDDSLRSIANAIAKLTDDHKAFRTILEKLSLSKTEIDHRHVAITETHARLSDKHARCVRDANLIRERLEAACGGVGQCGQVLVAGQKPLRSLEVDVSYRISKRKTCFARLVATASVLVLESTTNADCQLCVETGDIEGVVCVDDQDKCTACIFMRDGYKNRFLFDPKVGEILPEKSPKYTLFLTGAREKLILIPELLDRRRKSQSSARNAILSTIVGESNIVSEKTLKKLLSQIPARHHFRAWRCAYCTERDGRSVRTFLRKLKDARESVLLVWDTDREIFGGFASFPWINHTSYFGDGESFVFKMRIPALNSEIPNASESKSSAVDEKHYETIHSESPSNNGGNSNSPSKLNDKNSVNRSNNISAEIKLSESPSNNGGNSNSPFKLNDTNSVSRPNNISAKINVSKNPNGSPNRNSSANPNEFSRNEITMQIERFPATLDNNYFQLVKDDSITMGGGSHPAIYLDREFHRGSSGKCETFDSPCLAGNSDFECVCVEVWVPDEYGLI